jgi:hypothetical protein
MTLQVYPTLPGLTYPVLKAADFDTLLQTAANKYEVALPQTVNPIWSWQLIYDFVRDFLTPGFTVTELRTLLDFFLYQQGQAGEFLFLDPDDNYVGPAMVNGSPNTPLAQLQLVTDGNGNYYSPLQRTFGGLFYEDITDLNTNTAAGGSALAAYANGVLQTPTTNYTVGGPGLAVPGASFMGLYLQWTSQPATPITAQFNFYFRARFETDSRDMEKFVNQFWTVGGSESKNGSGYVKLMQRRPNPL